jgi:ATP-dependent Clp protease, protease subunit
MTTTIHRIRNQIFYRGSTNLKNINELCKQISILNTSSDKTAAAYGDIKVFLYSPGGDLYPAFMGYNYIRESRKPVTIIADGFVASAATLLMMAGARKLIRPKSFLLLHQLSGSNISGNHSQIEDEVINNKLLMKNMKEIYMTSFKGTNEDLEKILASERIFDAKTVLRLGLADGLYSTEDDAC